MDKIEISIIENRGYIFNAAGKFTGYVLMFTINH